jgi:DNA polymerase-4
VAAGLCRDCLFWLSESEPLARCPACGGTRIIAHPELEDLTLAHIDCDAFYASVEKRDNPDLTDRPVIVGGAKRGVAMTACYVARRYGVHSAMPMFKALALCPQAVVIRPDMEKYARVSRQVREILVSATPMVEPVSLDEAYLDLSGTASVHARPAAATLADLARRIEHELGITVSIGLSCNKFLAKLASEIDKPRGFGVIGAREARGYLAGRPVRIIPGVGAKMDARLAADGITRIADLQALGPERLGVRYGAFGRRLAALAMGEDERMVVPDRDAKAVSAETTFERDLSTKAELEPELWRLCERVSERLKRARIAGRTVVLKLKTSEFRILTRRQGIGRPSQSADALYQVAAALLAPEIGRRRYRLIGAGMVDLVELDAVEPDLFAVKDAPGQRVESVLDEVRARFGRNSIGKGRGLRPPSARR